MKKSQEQELLICEELEKNNLIYEVKKEKYNINFIISIDNREDYSIRDRIISNFEDLGYVVYIRGRWWLVILIEDIYRIIDDCFEVVK